MGRYDDEEDYEEEAGFGVEEEEDGVRPSGPSVNVFLRPGKHNCTRVILSRILFRCGVSTGRKSVL